MAVPVDQWLAVRRRLNQSRGPLTRSAALWYPTEWSVAGTPFLALWLPDRPVPVDDLRLVWSLSPRVPAPALDFLPEGHSSYSAAIGGVDRPALFEDRPCYRLLAVADGRLTFGPGRYFDKLDSAEALAHEYCAGGSSLRSQINDPFDLLARSVIPDVQTLVISRDGRFLVQWRDPMKVATNGGVHGLVPTGEFQPSGSDVLGDLNLRRLVAREYAEEIRGVPELVDPPASFYEPFRLMPLHVLGIGLDPLTLAASILTVAVVDSLDDAVDANAEGRVVRSGLPFDAATVGRFVRREAMTPAGAAALALAWRARANSR
ncbi:hypothetical protein [Kutzneria sp. CA-103260]|uniref:hypothetical protein n=1 Tax=Kutzneria sp. CA-103260 TaxID=2802641 RepID=UPI001BAB61E0|nr:hypothetical protein [Kutzneria sp. CA-103260]QUQ64953.1 hypothetical protein JJ691_26740 [Kutzneria sp. CA-103260]